MEKGFLAAEGVKFDFLKYVHGTQYETIASGKVDVLGTPLEHAIKPLANGLPAKITTGTHTGCMRVLTSKSSGVNSLAELKGKSIGLPSLGSGVYLFTARVLADAGIKVGDKDSEVEFKVIPNAELPLALEKGVVDAIALVDPVGVLAIENYGLITLVDQATTQPYADLICCIAMISDKLLDEHPELAAKVTRAIQKASIWVHQNPDETAALVTARGYVAGTAELIARVLKTYDYSVVSVHDAQKSFAVSVIQLQQIGLLDNTVDANALIQNSFVFLDGVK
jgi:NitT/TauT family transport system substrate-binding protein